MKKLLITFVTMLTAYHAVAQDPNFSQFFASPLTLNPALTGKFNGMVRVAGNYRNQWPTINNAFRTATASADFGILENKTGELDRFGAGIMGMYDMNGDGIMKSNYVSASLAYHKGIDESGYHQLSVGFSGTYAQRRVDFSKLDFEDELTSLGFTGTTTEFLGNNGLLNLRYADLNAGILYTGATNDYNSFYFGASVYHINRPKVSFQGADYSLQPRITVHGGGYFPAGDGITVFLSGIHQQQAGASETMIGGAIGIDVNSGAENLTTLYAGGWWRSRDAIVPYVGMEFRNYQLGISYDVNTSLLRTASKRRGGMEISLIYIQQHKDPNRRKMNCPRF
ncbi:MAG: PorP/SprF family type IX secretion system membrane protein [Chitinophagaceae bacterium]